MKKPIIIAAAALMLCSCTVENDRENASKSRTTRKTTTLTTTTAASEYDTYTPDDQTDMQTTTSPQTARRVDPFEGLEVQFDGVSPYLNVSLNTSRCDPEVQTYVTFTVEERETIANGDSIRVTAELDLSRQDMPLIELTSHEKDFSPMNCAQYVTDFSLIDTTELDEQIEDYMNAHKNDKGDAWGSIYENGDGLYGILGAPMNISGEFVSFKSSERIKSYQLILKSNHINSNEIQNYYVAEYKNIYNVLDEGKPKEAELYIFVKVSNVINYIDGHLRYDKEITHTADIIEEEAYQRGVSSYNEKYNIDEIDR